MIPSDKRRLNWLWENRDALDGLQSQITQIFNDLVTVNQGVANAPEVGAYIHLTRNATQSIDATGELVEWDTEYTTIPRFGFHPTLTLPLTEITIPKTGYYNIATQLGWDTFEGGGNVKVYRNPSGENVQVWPPLDDPGLWTTDAAQFFEGVAPAIPLFAGDTVGVWLDPDDVSAQNLASATLGVYLVDRSTVEAVSAALTFCPVIGSSTVVSSVDHDAFPGFVIADDGTFVVLYRQGAGHTSLDGVIRIRTSTDNGTTWSSPTTLLNDSSYDYRGATLTKLASGRIVAVIEVRSSGGSDITDGGFTFYSDDDGATWSTAVQVNDSFTLWSRPISLVELANGDWLVSVYGRDTGDTEGSVRMILSDDDGATWSTLATVADGPTDGLDYTEAGLVMVGSTVFCFIRRDIVAHSHGEFLYRSVSEDGGNTWTSPVLARNNVGGRPIPLVRANGDFVAVLRKDPDPGFAAALYRSTDLGASWEECQEFDDANDQLDYAQCAELNGQLLMVYSDTVARNTTADADLLFRAEI